MKTKYVGTVTDISWWNSLFNLTSTQEIYNAVGEKDGEYERSLDLIFSLRRLPRIYLDEYKQQEKK